MTPAYEITANGKSVTKLFDGRLRSLSVKDEAGMGLDSCTIEVEDSDRTIAVPEKDTEIEVSLGYAGQMVKMGHFTINEFSTQGPPDTLRIDANAASFGSSAAGKAMQASKTRSWDASTVGAVAKQIAHEHDLTLEISSTDAAIALPHLDQTAESDMNFLTRIGVDHDLHFKPSFGKLAVVHIKKSKKTDGTAIAVITIKRNEVSSYSFTGMTRTDFTGVLARWHDATTGKEQSTLAGTNTVPFTIQALQANEAVAKAAAAARLACLQRQTGEFSVEMPGRTDIIAEGRLQLVGFRSAYDNIIWRIDSAEHTIDKAGYRTRVSGKVFSAAE
jgi:uncharacterized protein